jgi:KDO2-lipid IV(A) lauroyltransferase
MKALGFYIYLILFRPFLWLPLRFWYALSDVLYYVMYYVLGYRKKVVMKNLANAFPDKDETWKNNTAKKFFRHLGDYFIESLKLDGFKPKELKKRCTFKNLNIIEKAANEKRDIVAFLGHYGNWEWVTSLPLWVDLNCLTVYKPLRNKYFDRYFLDVRRRFGVIPVPMKMAARELIRFNKFEQRNISGLIADQNPGKFDVRYWVRFLNQDTAVFEGGEKIASKINACVVFFKMKKIRRGYYETEIIPMFDDASKTERHEITRRYFELLEDTIIEQPELWLWSHKRWKRNRPDGVGVNALRG